MNKKDQYIRFSDMWSRIDSSAARYFYPRLAQIGLSRGQPKMLRFLGEHDGCKQKTHLPVIVDPSHASGIRSLVEPLSLAAIAAGADGLIIEVHNNPEKALCDGAQSLTPEMFDALMKKIDRSVEFFRELS